MSYFKDCLEIITMLCFLYYMYSKVRKPRIKEVAKTVKPRKKKKRLRCLNNPHKGKAQIVQYDKKSAYIESAWNEVQKPKKR